MARLNRNIWAQARLEKAASFNQLGAGICIIFGVLQCCVSSQMGSGAPSEAYLIMFGIMCLVYFLPAILYLVFAASIRAGRNWAAITSIIIASLHGAMWAMLFFLGFLRLYFQRDPAFASFVFVFVAGCILASSIAIIVMCSRSFSAMRLLREPHGFEVIPLATLAPELTPELASEIQPPEIVDPQSFDEPIDDPGPSTSDSGDWPEIR